MSGLGQAWDELVADALLGTDRRPPSLSAVAALEGPLGRLLEQVAHPGSPSRRDLPGPGPEPPVPSEPTGRGGGEAETALLRAATIVSLYRQAGRRPRHVTEPLPVPCPVDPCPRCSEAAARRLRALLAGAYPQVLPEWLGLVAAAGRRAPEEMVPALLELGRARRELRPGVLSAAGQRGRWLAAQNPDWAFARGSDDPEETWRTGGREARRLVLARLREEDPARARDLVAPGWEREPAEERARWLAAFETGLSMADEAFLEEALDDRAREVRQVAARLLGALPASRLAARMAERARGRLRVEDPARPRLEVTAPESVDPALARDGVEPRPPAGRVPRSWWLEQLVTASPLAVWEDDTGQLPTELVRLAQAGDEGPALLRGWTAAARRQGNSDWALALLEVSDDPTLLDALSGEEAERLVAERLGRARTLSPELLALVDRFASPWSPQLSRAVLAALATSIPRAAGLRPRLSGLAVRLDPSVAPEAFARLEPVLAAGGAWGASAAAFLDLLAFRHDMVQELAEDGR